MPTDDQDQTPASIMAVALMEFGETISQFRYHTNGIRQQYIDDGYQPAEAAAMAAADHVWMMAMLTNSLTQQQTGGDDASPK